MWQRFATKKDLKGGDTQGCMRISCTRRLTGISTKTRRFAEYAPNVLAREMQRAERHSIRLVHSYNVAMINWSLAIDSSSCDKLH
jgi:hypothetical protein